MAVCLKLKLDASQAMRAQKPTFRHPLSAFRHPPPATRHPPSPKNYIFEILNISFAYAGLADTLCPDLNPT